MSKTDADRALPAISDRNCSTGPEGRPAWTGFVPGLLLAVLATLASAYLSDHYGVPLTLAALLVGLSLNFVSADHRVATGLTFASATLLRVGIVLLGARVTLAQIADLGPLVLLVIVIAVIVTVASGVLTARLLGFSAAFGILAGGAVAICGASAALAVAAVLGERRVSRADLALVLITVSALSSLAMLLYPILLHQLGLDSTAAGFVLGVAIHDVAQTLGAGYSVSQHVGDTAAIVKLTRVALLGPVLVVTAVFFPGGGGKTRGMAGLPWFVIGFFGLAGLNSAGLIPAAAGNLAQTFAGALIACAVAATGIRSPMHALIGSGWRAPLVLLGPTVAALILAVAVAMSLFD